MALGMSKDTSGAVHVARLRKMPMSFLRKGDRFVAKRGNVYVTGVADMDGHKGSSDYGTRTGNDFYDDREKNYINVKLDGVEYDLFGTYGVNTGMFERDDWEFFVTPEIYSRFLRDKTWTPMTDARTKEKQKLEEKLVRLESEMREVRHAISNL